jgi:hypothetical protein
VRTRKAKAALRGKPTTGKGEAPRTRLPAPSIEQPPVKVVGSERLHKLLADPILQHTLGRLASVMRNGSAEQPTDSELSFGVGMFTRLDPANAAEVLLCSQMIATHEVAMELLTRAKLASHMPQLEGNGGLALKLLGMFERQFATLQRGRRPQQTVKVEHVHRHVHLNANGTETPAPIPGPGDVAIIEGQAHEATNPRALAFAASAAMPGEEPQGAPLPAGSDRQGPMPPSRRGSG